MLFNSIAFLLFLPCFFLVYWLIFNRNTKQQNLLILVGSYFFYGWFDYRFLSLIFFSTVIDFFLAGKIHQLSDGYLRKKYLYISIVFNISLLGLFKYYNFFLDSIKELSRLLGYSLDNFNTLNIILPVGISFYTFQTMSYTLDVFNKKIKPTKDFISFASFVSFFPQLVAGPIERATNLLPQMLRKRSFDYDNSIQGLRLILFGLFKKVVISDSLAPMVEYIFQNYSSLGGGVLLLGALYFSFQIYCDFSGYSDIAIGVSKLLGFELMSNFKFPYFSRNIGEFWRKWHISLSTWFRDYLYIPLGGSKSGKFKSLRNIFIIFLVSGLWHGANWTFIFWGLYNAFLFIPSYLFKSNRKYLNSTIADGKCFPSLREIFLVLKTNLLVIIGWIFFRSETLYDSLHYLYVMVFKFNTSLELTNGIFYVILILIIDYMIRSCERLSYKLNEYIDTFLMVIFSTLIVYYFNRTSGFIYFQF